jgi:hypothetical protein
MHNPVIRDHVGVTKESKTQILSAVVNTCGKKGQQQTAKEIIIKDGSISFETHNRTLRPNP